MYNLINEGPVPYFSKQVLPVSKGGTILAKPIMDEKKPAKDEIIPPVFISRKNKILADLSAPAEEYSDLSPKGSVDEGIHDLIQDINTLPGLVTTSSCAGRISVFLEGRRVPNPSEEISQASEQRKFVPSGGKGAGKWLYVSHEPLDVDNSSENKERKSLHETFGMTPGDGKPPGIEESQGHAPRLVRFHFEPLVSLVSGHYVFNPCLDDLKWHISFPSPP